MRLRRVKNAQNILESTDFVIQNPKKHKNKFWELFGNKNPIHVEIGMGKGQFLLKMALKFPDINFVGIEKSDSILVRAVEKISEHEIKNIRIICIDASEIVEVFGKEVSNIYLNFSDPWPKARHFKRRLTSSIFLELYEQILINERTITQKTDNVILFESSIESFAENNWQLLAMDRDLANSEIDTETTEYEDKFRSLGQSIYYIKVTKGENL